MYSGQRHDDIYTMLDTTGSSLYSTSLQGIPNSIETLEPHIEEE